MSVCFHVIYRTSAAKSAKRENNNEKYRSIGNTIEVW